MRPMIRIRVTVARQEQNDSSSCNEHYLMHHVHDARESLDGWTWTLVEPSAIMELRRREMQGVGMGLRACKIP